VPLAASRTIIGEVGSMALTRLIGVVFGSVLAKGFMLSLELLWLSCGVWDLWNALLTVRVLKFVAAVLDLANDEQALCTYQQHSFKNTDNRHEYASRRTAALGLHLLFQHVDRTMYRVLSNMPSYQGRSTAKSAWLRSRYLRRGHVY
jgi:hypothetical protein